MDEQLIDALDTIASQLGRIADVLESEALTVSIPSGIDATVNIYKED